MTTDWHLEKLGWRAFQDLCGAVLREVLGQSAQTFEDGNDAGRDGAFRGIWRDELRREDLAGAFTVQVKFSSDPGANISLTSLTDELAKVPSLVEKGLCDVYVLMTNAKVTATSEQKIREALNGLGVPEVRVWARPWISGQLDSNSQLRRLAPRVYGLGDLTSIIDERLLQQAEAVLAYLGSNAATFVETAAYYESLNALNEHGFVLLLGGPTVGKSVIAQMLTLGAIDAHAIEPLKVSSAEEFLASWNPTEDGKRIYWVDDAFGDLSTNPDLVNSWLRRMSNLLAAKERGSRFIFTSRDYIYREAQRVLKESQYPIWRESKIEVLVTALSPIERQRILYTHLKLGDQPVSFKKLIKPHLEMAAELEGFTPGLAARMGSRAFTHALDPSREQDIQSFFDEPSEYLQEVIRELPSRDFAALALLYSEGPDMLTPLADPSAVGPRLLEMGGTLAGLESSLQALNGTYVRGVSSGITTKWTFWHPTIRQAVASLLQSNSATVSSLIEGTNIADLAGMVDMRPINNIPTQERGRFLVVGGELQDKVLNRFTGSEFDAAVKERTTSFTLLAQLAVLLVDRATPSIRAKYVQEAGVHLERWARSSFQYARQGLSLYALLHVEGELPQSIRDLAARTIRQDALGLDTAYWKESSSVRRLLTTTQYDDLRTQVADGLRTDYDEVIDNLEMSWDSSYSPESYLEDNRQALEDYLAYFDDDPEMQGLIEERIDSLDRLQAQLDERYSPDEGPDDWRESRTFSAQEDQSGSERSLFDDVDE